VEQIEVAVALVFDDSDRVLLVRKRGTEHFQLPGGKIEKGETPAAAACREVKEETKLDLEKESLLYLGGASGRAMVEHEATVHAQVFAGRKTGKASASAEIEELRWHDLGAPDEPDFAHLLKECTLPMARDFLANKSSRGPVN